MSDKAGLARHVISFCLLTFTPLALAGHADGTDESPDAHCTRFLTAREKGIQMSASAWEPIMDVLQLNDSQKTNVRGVAHFTFEALSARAQGKELSELTSPYLSEQAQLLHKIIQKMPGRIRTKGIDNRLLAGLQKVDEFLVLKGDKITWLELFTAEVHIAVIDEAASLNRMPSSSRRQSDDPRRSDTLENWYGLAFDRLEGEIDPQNPEIQDLSVTIGRGFKTFGFVAVPMLKQFSQKELLALAFLPVHPMSFYLEPSYTRFGPASMGAEIFLADFLTAGSADDTSGYTVTGLQDKSPAAWVTTIHASWANWFHLLGGRDPFYNENREAVIRSLLWVSRYRGAEEEVDWSQAGNVAIYLLDDLVFWPNRREYLLNPNHQSFFEEEAKQYFAELWPPGVRANYEISELIEATDVMISRVLYTDKVDLRGNAEAKLLFEKFPETAASAKYYILKFYEP